MVIDISETKCTLRWEPSEDDGGADVKHYIVEYFRDVWEVWLKAKTTKDTLVIYFIAQLAEGQLTTEPLPSDAQCSKIRTFSPILIFTPKPKI